MPEALAGERVDRAVALLTGWTRGEVQDLIEAGAVLVDGERVVEEPQLEAGERRRAARPSPRRPGCPSADPSIAVVVRYEDDDLIVIAKPAGLVVHPGAGHPDGTLVNGLLARYPEIADVGDPARPGIVHRLDRDTSGLLVVARTPARLRGASSTMLAAHDVERRYVALVWGTPRVAARRDRRADRPLGAPPDPDGGARGRPRGAHPYEVRDRVPRSRRRRCSTCRLETGRTHQIRVHLQAIGHPVVGDAGYGGARPALALDRPFLHAGGLAFAHPVTGEPVGSRSRCRPSSSSVLSRSRLTCRRGRDRRRRRQSSASGPGRGVGAGDGGRGGRGRRPPGAGAEAADGGVGLGVSRTDRRWRRAHGGRERGDAEPPPTASSLRRCIASSRTRRSPPPPCRHGRPPVEADVTHDRGFGVKAAACDVGSPRRTTARADVERPPCAS